jgi:hypothetical protein
MSGVGFLIANSIEVAAIISSLSHPPANASTFLAVFFKFRRDTRQTF